MVAAKGEGIRPVKVEDVAGKVKIVLLNHFWIGGARLGGADFDD